MYEMHVSPDGFPVFKNVQYWRLVSTRKIDLSIRTSRTNRLMYSRVVVDPCMCYQIIIIHDTSGTSQGPCGCRLVRVVTLVPVKGPSQVLCAEKVLSVSNDMHGSTTTREYIRRPVRMDKSALRVDTSRQYWTTLIFQWHETRREVHLGSQAAWMQTQYKMQTETQQLIKRTY